MHTYLRQLFVMFALCFVASTSNATLTVNGNGTVTDSVTELVWDQCVLGRSTSSTACDTGSAATYDWPTALAQAAAKNAAAYMGYTDWRVPNVKELLSITKIDTYTQNVAATDVSAFPNTPLPVSQCSQGCFWTSTPAYAPSNVMAVEFALGTGSNSHPSSANHVRLVRGGPAAVSTDLMHRVNYLGNNATSGNPPADSADYFNTENFTVLGNTGNLARAGQAFTGWNSAADGTGQARVVGLSYAMGSVDVNLYAQWTINAYTVTPSAGTGGSISPSGVQTVNHGSTTSFTVSPSPGYSIASVGGTCGGSLSGSTFTTAAVTGNCAVTATFSAIPPVDTTTPTADIPLFNVAAGCSTIGGPSPVNMQQGAGPAFLTDMLAILGNAISQQLNFAGQGGCGALVIFYSGGTLSFMPYGFVANDPRPNGIYPVGNGQFQIVRNGQSLTVALSLVNLDQLAALLRAVTSNRIDIEGAKVLPAGTIMQTEGGALIANLNGTTYAVQPALNVQKDPPIAQASFSIDASGQVHFTDTQGNNQILYPAFAEPASLRSIVQSLLPGATVNVQLDGTALVEANGVRLTLVPDMVLTNTPADRAGQTWWQESATRFRFANVSFYLNGLTQGLTLKP